MVFCCFDDTLTGCVDRTCKERTVVLYLLHYNLYHRSVTAGQTPPSSSTSSSTSLSISTSTSTLCSNIFVQHFRSFKHCVQQQYRRRISSPSSPTIHSSSSVQWAYVSIDAAKLRRKVHAQQPFTVLIEQKRTSFHIKQNNNNNKHDGLMDPVAYPKPASLTREINAYVGVDACVRLVCVRACVQYCAWCRLCKLTVVTTLSWLSLQSCAATVARARVVV